MNKNINAAYEWKCQPQAENLILDLLNKCCEASPFIANLQEDLRLHTSTRLFDWLDHVSAGHSDALAQRLEEAGFISHTATPYYRVFHHPGAQLPRFILRDDPDADIGIAVVIDSIADFLMVRGMSGWIEGTPCGPYRRAMISRENGAVLWAVERRGTQTLEPTYLEDDYTERYLEAREKWQTRPRTIIEDEAMTRAIFIAEELVSAFGQDLSAWIVLEAERMYWQARNTAGQLQKNRQDRLGMGWGNHDHHTFRSSRKQFTSLVRLFEVLGFQCRERFYAGEEAGWGAQVMENSRAELVLFLDVDLSPDEIAIDFSHQQLPEREKLGTIGLWCALHGDSILKAGMHHLEAQFLFEELTKDLATTGVGMMEAFSNFPYLKQAFTAGEVWRVDHKRVEELVTSNKITSEQAEKFLKYGAVGSHLENLQRREGYKGFNQKNVSIIIQKTDPRTLQDATTK